MFNPKCPIWSPVYQNFVRGWQCSLFWGKFSPGFATEYSKGFLFFSSDIGHVLSHTSDTIRGGFGRVRLSLTLHKCAVRASARFNVVWFILRFPLHIFCWNEVILGWQHFQIQVGLHWQSASKGEAGSLLAGALANGCPVEFVEFKNGLGTSSSESVPSPAGGVVRGRTDDVVGRGAADCAAFEADA